MSGSNFVTVDIKSTSGWTRLRCFALMGFKTGNPFSRQYVVEKGSSFASAASHNCWCYECMSCQHVIVLLLMCCVFDAVNILVAVTWMYIAFIGNLSSLVSILNEVGKSTKVLWMLQGQILSNMQIHAGRPNSTSNYIVFPPNSTSNLWSSNN